MNPRVSSFPALIRWIADKHHDGAVLPIAAKVGVSPALVHLWATGNTKNPKLDSLEQLCDAYGLDFNFVRGLLRRRTPTPIAGGSGTAAPRSELNHNPDTGKKSFIYTDLRHVPSQTLRRSMVADLHAYALAA